MEDAFDSLTNHIKNLLKDEISISKLRKNELDLTKIFESYKSIHDDIIELPLEQECTADEIDWIRQKHDQIESCISNQEAKAHAKECAEEHAKENPLRMEKVRLPLFSGSIKEYPQFKADFKKHVMPTISETNAPYVLRSCLSNEPLERVKNVDDDLKEMWACLDEKYGDPAKVTDVIISEIQNFKSIKDGDNHKFLEFISIIENAYRDLCRLGIEHKITTTSLVGIIEKKLPENIKDELAKLISVEADKKNKFSILLKFLLQQKKAIEYKLSKLRSSSQSVRESAHYTEAEHEPDEKNQTKRVILQRCTFHDISKHWTSDCKLYLSKSVEERKQLLKDKKASWSCLKPGHRMKDCRCRRNCGINRCTERHHPSIHSDEKVPTAESEAQKTYSSSANGTANTCTGQSVSETCLLQVQQIQSKHGWLNVMWGNGAALCFITNAKAKAQKLKGTEVQLTLVKVGGKNETIKLQRYILPLFDKDGQKVKFTVYGIDKINSDLQHVNIDGIIKLFKDVPKEQLVWSMYLSGMNALVINVLIGYEYVGYHPSREQSVGHLVLSRNRFGRCIGGMHPSGQAPKEIHPLLNAQTHIAKVVRVEDFYNIENLGIQFLPKCGGCKCGKCAPGSKNCTLKEEKELELIEQNLEFDAKTQSWITEYTWMKDPNELPNNRKAAYRMLISN